MTRRNAWCAPLVLAVLSCGAPAAARQRAAAPPAASATEQIVSLLESGNLASAKIAVDDALRRRPDDPALHNLAGVVAAQQGAADTAEAHFTTAVRLAPRAIPPYENLARLYQERSGRDPGARKKALEAYGEILSIDPKHVEALYQSAFLLVLNGQFGEARSFAERLPDRIRRRPQALAVLAAAAVGAGHLVDADAFIDALARHPDLSAPDVVAVLPALQHADGARAARMVEALDRKAMATPDLLEYLGASYLKARRFEEARAVLERAAAGGPRVPVLMNLARAAYQLRDYKGALGYLAHARALEPENAAVHLLFGMVCVEQDLGREAYDSLKRAVELDPENPMINYAMGAVATHRRDPSESLPFFEKYVRLKPDDPRGRFALGAARFYAKQFDEAARDLEIAARSPETATGSHYFLARIARQSNDLEAARREIAAALERNPSYADAWAELGLLQTRSGEYAEAEQSLQKALSLEPDNYQATVNLATLYGRTNDPRSREQTAKVTALLEARAARAQEFLRMVEVVP